MSAHAPATRENPWVNEDGPFFGRKDYLAELRDALFFSKVPRHISIYGMPKVGKTRLLKEVIKDPPDKVVPLLSSIADSFYYVLQCTFFKQDFWTHCSEFEELAPFFSEFDKLRRGTGVTKILALLRKFLQKTTQLGYRAVLLLDEFDNIKMGQESAWTEDEYSGLVELLMDRSLNLACATASRRTVESLISHNKYRWRLNPFESWLLTGFDEEEMEECFQCLENTGCPVPSGEELDRLMYRCGRSPYLLSHLMLTLYAKSGGTIPLDEAYQKCRADFAAHFGHVLTFMWQEEKLQEHSFSHIVKCYFDPSPDYRDIQERFIGMGYLELLDPNSRFTWSGYRDKFVYQDTDLRYENAKFADKLAPGSHQHTYITLSPLFISQFYTAKFPVEPGEADRGTVLDQVKDTKDLLTSFVHTLRDITAEELQQASCADCQHKAKCPRCGKGEMAGVFGADWNEKLLRNCVKAPGKSKSYGGLVLFKDSSALDGTFVTKDIPSGDVRCIKISSPAVFLLSAFNRSAAERSRAPLLDPINLSSNGTLIRSFLPRFQNYFGCFQSFSSDPSKDFMPALKHLEDARNEIAHYSRVGMTAVMAKDTAALCRYLLRSIYLWRSEGIVSPPSAPPKWNS